MKACIDSCLLSRKFCNVHPRGCAQKPRAIMLEMLTPAFRCSCVNDDSMLCTIDTWRPNGTCNSDTYFCFVTWVRRVGRRGLGRGATPTRQDLPERPHSENRPAPLMRGQGTGGDPVEGTSVIKPLGAPRTARPAPASGKQTPASTGRITFDGDGVNGPPLPSAPAT